MKILEFSEGVRGKPFEEWTEQGKELPKPAPIRFQDELVPWLASQGIIRLGISTAWRCPNLPQSDAKMN